MDDLEFRRQIMSDPKARDEELLKAIAESDVNAKFADEMNALDAQIAQAMKVDVPDDLADRILFSQSSSHKVIRPNFTKKAMAMAASLAFVVGLSVGQLNWGNLIVPAAQASLEAEAMRHVVAEKPFVNAIDEEVSSTQINTKLKPFAYQFNQNFPYHVYYLNHCGFGDSNALHMVFRGEKGKVTLFITNLPSENENIFSQDGMAGAITPIGDSSIIIVGDMDENVGEIARKLAPMLTES
ncbi:DUF3379 domain-containing protein [Vibrio maerlii]|uniref:DUF3379 domain-containing protein n=1 Tax=Vibrio maerlii TaxID=2231648 RepID=UPI000E3BC7AC|nr:DUF3379 domain-containing protein [Vibrio maerlii]